MARPMTLEEQEIKQFFDEGLSIEDIAFCTGRSVYRLKKFLTPDLDRYIFRYLDEIIPQVNFLT